MHLVKSLVVLLVVSAFVQSQTSYNFGFLSRTSPSPLRIISTSDGNPKKVAIENWGKGMTEEFTKPRLSERLTFDEVIRFPVPYYSDMQQNVNSQNQVFKMEKVDCGPAEGDRCFYSLIFRIQGQKGYLFSVWSFNQKDSDDKGLQFKQEVKDYELSEWLAPQNSNPALLSAISISNTEVQYNLIFTYQTGGTSVAMRYSQFSTKTKTETKLFYQDSVFGGRETIPNLKKVQLQFKVSPQVKGSTYISLTWVYLDSIERQVMNKLRYTELQQNSNAYIINFTTLPVKPTEAVFKAYPLKHESLLATYLADFELLASDDGQDLIARGSFWFDLHGTVIDFYNPGETSKFSKTDVKIVLTPAELYLLSNRIISKIEVNVLKEPKKETKIFFQSDKAEFSTIKGNVNYTDDISMDSNVITFNEAADIVDSRKYQFIGRSGQNTLQKFCLNSDSSLLYLLPQNQILVNDGEQIGLFKPQLDTQANTQTNLVNIHVSSDGKLDFLLNFEDVDNKPTLFGNVKVTVESFGSYSTDKAQIVSNAYADSYVTPYQGLKNAYISPGYSIKSLKVQSKDVVFGKDDLVNTSYVSYQDNILKGSSSANDSLLEYKWLSRTSYIAIYSNKFEYQDSSQNRASISISLFKTPLLKSSPLSELEEVGKYKSLLQTDPNTFIPMHLYHHFHKTQNLKVSGNIPYEIGTLLSYDISQGHVSIIYKNTKGVLCVFDCVLQSPELQKSSFSSGLNIDTASTTIQRNGSYLNIYNFYIYTKDDEKGLGLHVYKKDANFSDNIFQEIKVTNGAFNLQKSDDLVFRSPSDETSNYKGVSLKTKFDIPSLTISLNFILSRVDDRLSGSKIYYNFRNVYSLNYNQYNEFGSISKLLIVPNKFKRAGNAGFQPVDMVLFDENLFYYQSIDTVNLRAAWNVVQIPKQDQNIQLQSNDFTTVEYEASCTNNWNIDSLSGNIYSASSNQICFVNQKWASNRLDRYIRLSYDKASKLASLGSQSAWFAFFEAVNNIMAVSNDGTAVLYRPNYPIRQFYALNSAYKEDSQLSFWFNSSPTNVELQLKLSTKDYLVAKDMKAKSKNVEIKKGQEYTVDTDTFNITGILESVTSSDKEIIVKQGSAQLKSYLPIENFKPSSDYKIVSVFSPDWVTLPAEGGLNQSFYVVRYSYNGGFVDYLYLEDDEKCAKPPCQYLNYFKISIDPKQVGPLSQISFAVVENGKSLRIFVHGVKKTFTSLFSFQSKTWISSFEIALGDGLYNTFGGKNKGCGSILSKSVMGSISTTDYSYFIGGYCNQNDYFYLTKVTPNNGVEDVDLDELNKYDVRAVAGVDGEALVVVTGVLHEKTDPEYVCKTYVRIQKFTNLTPPLTDVVVLKNVDPVDQLLCSLFEKQIKCTAISSTHMIVTFTLSKVLNKQVFNIQQPQIWVNQLEMSLRASYQGFTLQ